MQSEIVRRKCDWCGEQEDFGKNDDRPETLDRNSQWITLARLYFPNGQQYPVVKHACKTSCAVNILGTGMLELPQEIVQAVAAQKVRITEETASA